MDEKILRLFIGFNANYYLRKWSSAGYLERLNTWNWGAFIFSYFWLAYRKMYSYCALFVFLGLLLTFISLVFRLPLEYLLTMQLLVPGLIGFFGNRMYYYFINSQVDRIYAMNLETKSRQRLIQSAGGTNISAAVLLMFILSFLSYGLLLLFNLVPPAFLPVKLWEIILS
jgi:hypothetical protein